MGGFQKDVLYSEWKSTKSTTGWWVGRHQKVGTSVLCNSNQFTVYLLSPHKNVHLFIF